MNNRLVGGLSQKSKTMKISTLIVSFLISSWFLNSDKTEINTEVTVNGVTYLYGEINRAGLKSANYKSWFTANYNRYQPKTEKLASIKNGRLEGLKVKLLMATWCGDSKRNVPIFYKILDSIGFNEEQLQVWALDRRKHGPNNEQIQYGVTRVPTIIFYRNDKEIGRFVERLKPGENMEDIIIGIINKK